MIDIISKLSGLFAILIALYNMDRYSKNNNLIGVMGYSKNNNLIGVMEMGLILISMSILIS